MSFCGVKGEVFRRVVRKTHSRFLESSRENQRASRTFPLAIRRPFHYSPRIETMKTNAIKSTLLCCLFATSLGAKPLKVFILCGQSNMEGHAQTRTFPAIAKDPKTADLYKDMVGADGKPVICEDVWIADSYGDFSGNPIGKKSGKLTAGFGSQHHVGTGKIGPEFTFGIYMHKLLNEPVLLIKDAWGGKSLMVDFRPPSAGELPDAKSKDKAGVYYKLLIDHVKEVLADPKAVYPDYNPRTAVSLPVLSGSRASTTWWDPIRRRIRARARRAARTLPNTAVSSHVSSGTCARTCQRPSCRS